MENEKMIPYGRQLIDNNDISAVCSALKSDWLTTGPTISEFENSFAKYVGSKYAVAVSSGTAALHCAMYAININEGDEVILSPMTFAATANCVIYQGGIPVFVDIETDTLLINPHKIEERITKKTKAIIAIDYAGQPCEYDELKYISGKYGLKLVSDSCHALGARFKEMNVGSIADLTIFSFHPVKHITSGEGGMITTNDSEFAQKMKAFRNHGIISNQAKQKSKKLWYYEMKDLGFNYRITDFQCALGLSQLNKLPEFLEKRRLIASHYDKNLIKEKVAPLKIKKNIEHAFHLYVIKVHETIDRDKLFYYLRENGIGVQVHYIPVYLHPYYQKKFKYRKNLCPTAIRCFKQIISLPISPSINFESVDKVIENIEKFINNHNQVK